MQHGYNGAYRRRNVFLLVSIHFLSPAPTPLHRTWAPRKHSPGIASQGGNIHQPWHQSSETPRKCFLQFVCYFNVFQRSFHHSCHNHLLPIPQSMAEKGEGEFKIRPEFLISSHYFYPLKGVLYKHSSSDVSAVDGGCGRNQTVLLTDTSATRHLNWESTNRLKINIGSTKNLNLPCLLC